jgi:hypothetical protein
VAANAWAKRSKKTPWADVVDGKSGSDSMDQSTSRLPPVAGQDDESDDDSGDAFAGIFTSSASGAGGGLPVHTPKRSAFEDRFAEMDRLRQEGEQRAIEQQQQADHNRAEMQAAIQTSSNDMTRLFDTLTGLISTVSQNNTDANARMAVMEQSALDLDAKCKLMMGAMTKLTERFPEATDAEDDDEVAPRPSRRTKRAASESPGHTSGRRRSRSASGPKVK